MAEVGPARMAQLRTACPDFPATVVSGIVVTRVTPGSPAAAAGLTEDDVIVGLGGGGPAEGSSGFEAVLPQQGLGVSVAGLADALKASIGGSLELMVVREVSSPPGTNGSRNAAGSSGPAAAAAAAAGPSAGQVDPSGNSSSSSRGRSYTFVSVTLRPVEAGA